MKKVTSTQWNGMPRKINHWFWVIQKPEWKQNKKILFTHSGAWSTLVFGTKKRERVTPWHGTRCTAAAVRPWRLNRKDRSRDWLFNFRHRSIFVGVPVKVCSISPRRASLIFLRCACCQLAHEQWRILWATVQTNIVFCSVPLARDFRSIDSERSYRTEEKDANVIVSHNLYKPECWTETGKTSSAKRKDLSSFVCLFRLFLTQFSIFAPLNVFIQNPKKSPLSLYVLRNPRQKLHQTRDYFCQASF